MMKRTISMLLAMVLVLICVFPALAVPVFATNYGSGFKLTSDWSIANEFWAKVNIYDVLNSGESGMILICSTSSSSSPWYYLWFGNGYVYGTRASSIPTAQSEYPFLIPESATSNPTSFFLMVNYDAALARYQNTGNAAHFLTEDSYISFGKSGSYNKIYFYKLGYINSDGSVQYDAYTTASENFVKEACYSYIPADVPLFSQDLSLDPVSYEEGALADPLSVVAIVSDGGTLTYQWRGWSDNGMLNGDIIGTDSSYTPDTSVAGTYTYNCTVTNTTGTGIDGVATSSTATVIVTAPATTDPDDPDDSGGSGSSGGDSDNDVPILTDIFNALTEGLSDIQFWFTEQTQAINTWGQNIVDAINNWGQQIVDAIGDGMGQALEEAFVPSEDAIQEMTDNSQTLIADRFGAVYEGAQMIDQWAGQLTVQTAKPTLTVPAVTVNLAGVPFSFGGWEVDVIPKGFEFLAETCALVIDLIATLAFVNALRRRLESVLEG